MVVTALSLAMAAAPFRWHSLSLGTAGLYGAKRGRGSGQAHVKNLAIRQKKQ